MKEARFDGAFRIASVIAGAGPSHSMTKKPEAGTGICVEGDRSRNQISSASGATWKCRKRFRDLEPMEARVREGGQRVIELLKSALVAGHLAV